MSRVWLVVEEDGVYSSHVTRIAAVFSTKGNAEEWLDSLVFRARNGYLLYNDDDPEDFDLVKLKIGNDRFYEFCYMDGNPYNMHGCIKFHIMPMVLDAIPYVDTSCGMSFEQKHVDQPIEICFKDEDGCDETIKLYRIWDGFKYRYAYSTDPGKDMMTDILSKPSKAHDMLGSMTHEQWSQMADTLFNKLVDRFGE